MPLVTHRVFSSGSALVCACAAASGAGPCSSALVRAPVLRLLSRGARQPCSAAAPRGQLRRHTVDLTSAPTGRRRAPGILIASPRDVTGWPWRRSSSGGGGGGGKAAGAQSRRQTQRTTAATTAPPPPPPGAQGRGAPPRRRPRHPHPEDSVDSRWGRTSTPRSCGLCSATQRDPIQEAAGRRMYVLLTYRDTTVQGAGDCRLGKEAAVMSCCASYWHIGTRKLSYSFIYLLFKSNS